MRHSLLTFFAFIVVFSVSTFSLGAEEVSEVEFEIGKQVYQATCIACHGSNGKGLVPGTPNFKSKKSPLKAEESLLVDRIMNGYQSPGSLLPMPPKGGQVDLTEEQAMATVTYLKAIFLKDKKRG